MRFRLFSSAAAIAIAAFVSTSASATPIAPGGTISPVTTEVFSSANLLTSVSGAFSTSSLVSGTYTEWVYKGNSICPSCLTFVIKASNDSTSTDSLRRVNLTTPNSFTYDVGVSGAGGNPFSADESAAGTIGFNFAAGVVGPGNSTSLLVILSSAVNYTAGTIGVIDGGGTNAAGFVPAAATPEPSSLALLGTGLIGTATMVLRRRKLIA